MLSALEIFLGYALYKFTFYLLTYLLTYERIKINLITGVTTCNAFGRATVSISPLLYNLHTVMREALNLNSILSRSHRSNNLELCVQKNFISYNRRSEKGQHLGLPQ